jgi:hypothetical protein
MQSYHPEHTVNTKKNSEFSNPVTLHGIEQCHTTPEKMLIMEGITRSLVCLDISKQSM